jgi:hypothetical protein
MKPLKRRKTAFTDLSIQNLRDLSMPTHMPFSVCFQRYH